MTEASKKIPHRNVRVRDQRYYGKGISVCNVTCVRKNVGRRDKRGRECDNETQLETDDFY